jgi:DNA-binding HxlR family transcriptional regulator
VGYGYRNVTVYPQKMADLPTFDPDCPLRDFPLRIGEKWVAMIVLCLKDQPRRFTEIKRALPTISAKVLTETLRTMQRDGLVYRSSYDEQPPRVQYGLTGLGQSLLPLIDAVGIWASGHLDALLCARQQHDDCYPSQPESG